MGYLLSTGSFIKKIIATIFAIYFVSAPVIGFADWKKEFLEGVEFYNKGNLAQAIVKFDLAIEENPTEKRVRLYGLRYSDYMPFYFAGEALVRMQRFEEAIEYLNKSVDIGYAKKAPKLLATAKLKLSATNYVTVESSTVDNNSVLSRNSIVIDQEDGLQTVNLKSAENLYSGSYALLVGISKYTNGWRNLPTIPSELKAVQRALLSRGFEVTWEKDKTTRLEIEQVIRKFLDNHGYEPTNRIVFVYAGHGHNWVEGNRGYLVGSDAPLPEKSAGDPGQAFLRKAINIEQLVTWSRDMTVRHALFLLDNCFAGKVFDSGRQIDNIKPRPFNFDSAARPVRLFISAGGANETVPAQSVFMPKFVASLEHGDGDVVRDGVLTGTELSAYLRSEVPRWTDQTPQFGWAGPGFSEGEFVFFQN